MSMCTPASAGQCGGDESDLIEALTALDGVIATEQLDDEAMKVVTGIETSIRTVSGGMRIENRGILDCAGMSRNYVLFCGSGFPRPDQVTMEMVDDAGEVVGHDVPPCMVDAFRSRDDVIWMSDGFVLYPGLVCDRDVRMVMLSSTAWLPDWTTKSSGSKTMTLQMRPFLEKSSIFGPSAFLFQKKPETGVLTGHSRASVSSSANARPEALRDPGKRGRFMEGDLLKMRCH